MLLRHTCWWYELPLISVYFIADDGKYLVYLMPYIECQKEFGKKCNGKAIHFIKKQLSKFEEIDHWNNKQGKYEFDAYRKKSITNVQIKPHSCHDPTVINGILTGFMWRAWRICDQKYQENELTFLQEEFIKNGYQSSQLKKIIKQ